MKYTSEDLMKAMGLNVGDRVKHCNIIYNVDITDGSCYLKRDSEWLYLPYLIDGAEIEILPRPKRVGELECTGDCLNCPIMAVCRRTREDTYGKTLYDILYEERKINGDQEIYDLLKARLDKVVQE